MCPSRVYHQYCARTPRTRDFRMRCACRPTRSSSNVFATCVPQECFINTVPGLRGQGISECDVHAGPPEVYQMFATCVPQECIINTVPGLRGHGISECDVHACPPKFIKNTRSLARCVPQDCIMYHQYCAQTPRTWDFRMRCACLAPHPKSIKYRFCFILTVSPHVSPQECFINTVPGLRGYGISE